jgi:hypothetical protein
MAKVEFSKLALKNIIDGLELLALKKVRKFRASSTEAIFEESTASEEFEELRDLARVIEVASADSHVTLTFTDIEQWPQSEDRRRENSRHFGAPYFDRRKK